MQFQESITAFLWYNILVKPLNLQDICDAFTFLPKLKYMNVIFFVSRFV